LGGPPGVKIENLETKKKAQLKGKTKGGVKGPKGQLEVTSNPVCQTGTLNRSSGEREPAKKTHFWKKETGNQ